MRTKPLSTPRSRLKKIRDIIEAVENRCLAIDGPVTPTTKEITEKELQQIYRLARAALEQKGEGR